LGPAAGELMCEADRIMMSKKFLIREASVEDATQISEFGALTFEQAFGPFNTKQDMKEYLANSFNKARIRSQLLDPLTTFLLAYDDKRLVGYSMLLGGDAAETVSGKNPVELVRIYVDKSLVGKGYGSKIMEASIEKASEGNHDVLWLGVWEKNESAIDFYIRWGFKKVGSRQFLLGADLQNDFLMERLVNLAA
jgi:ribosomal protein S18 acetylase RimI-like enzyme